MKLFRLLKSLLSQINGNGIETDRLRLAIRGLGECGQGPTIENRHPDVDAVDGLSFVREPSVKVMGTKSCDIIDHATIERIRQYDDGNHGDTVGELIGLFLELTPKRIEHLKQSLALRNWRCVSKEAHSLKSSSANLGLQRLSAACRKLEAIENHPDDSTAHKLVSEIEAEYRTAAESLMGLLKRREPPQKASA